MPSKESLVTIPTSSLARFFYLRATKAKKNRRKIFNIKLATWLQRDFPHEEVSLSGSESEENMNISSLFGWIQIHERWFLWLVKLKIPLALMWKTHHFRSGSSSSRVESSRSFIKFFRVKSEKETKGIKNSGNLCVRLQWFGSNVVKTFFGEAKNMATR
jgi:hypothetical protein